MANSLGLLSSIDKAKLDYIDPTKLVYNTSVGNTKNSIPINNGTLNTSLNALMIEGYTIFNGIKLGSLKVIDVPSSLSGGWIRIAEIDSNPYLCCNFGISRMWMNSDLSSSFIFTLTTGMTTNTTIKPYILQTGCSAGSNNKLNKIRILYKKSSTIYLDLYIPTFTGSNDLIYVSCDLYGNPKSHGCDVKILDTPIKSTIPTGYENEEHIFSYNGTLRIDAPYIIGSPLIVKPSPTTIISNVSHDMAAAGVIQITTPIGGWDVNQVYKIYVSLSSSAIGCEILFRDGCANNGVVGGYWSNTITMYKMGIFYIMPLSSTTYLVLSTNTLTHYNEE